MILNTAFRFGTILLATLFLFACGDKGSESGSSVNNSVNTAANGKQPELAVQAVVSDKDAVKTLYQKTCIACHASGAAGAPRTGDTAAWDSRFESQGLEGLLSSTINGQGGMPPKGLCGQCDSDDFKALILYMSGR